MAGFGALGFGVFDGTHITIFCSPGGGWQYINCHSAHLVVLEAVKDHHGRFTDIYTGWAGGAHDAHVLHHSPLPGLREAWTFTPGIQDLIIEDISIPPVIMAGAVYRLLPWLMRPFPGPLDAQQKSYNEALTCCQCTVEQAFAWLKGLMEPHHLPVVSVTTHTPHYHHSKYPTQCV